jgi:hypothetical protein
MKIKQEFYATAKDGNIQVFNAYPIYKTGKFVTRFHVNNYKHGHPQWSGKMCSFDNQEDAIAFGYKIASSTKKAGDWPSIKNLVDINAAYRKSFE